MSRIRSSALWRDQEPTTTTLRRIPSLGGVRDQAARALFAPRRSDVGNAESRSHGARIKELTQCSLR